MRCIVYLHKCRTFSVRMQAGVKRIACQAKATNFVYQTVQSALTLIYELFVRVNVQKKYATLLEIAYYI